MVPGIEQPDPPTSITDPIEVSSGDRKAVLGQQARHDEQQSGERVGAD
jgi:hypothetical protein